MEILLNVDWNFKFGKDLIGEYSPIALPHTFQLPYYGKSEFYIGYGVYKRIIYINESDMNKIILLAFEGVFQHCLVIVNGNICEEHFGGYTAFDIDISNNVIAGDNEVIIKVDNIWRADVAPRAGEHVFCGGIYRDLRLVILNRSHIQRNSIFIHTEQVDTSRLTANINVDYNIVGDIMGDVEATITDDNNVLASERTQNLTNMRFELCNIDLWSPEHPKLYKLIIKYNGEQQAINFGIRTIRFDQNLGFFLNDKHYDIEGVNTHQDHGGWGDAVTCSGITRDIMLIKDAGFNFIRGSHYPKHSHFARECDRIGILFWSEVPFWGIGGFGDEGYWNCSAMPKDHDVAQRFSDSCLLALEEMIISQRNSPSIITWSMGNEIFFTHPDTLQSAKELAIRMVARAKELDGTRPVGLGGTQRGNTHTIGDVTGFNGDGAVLFKSPPIPNMVSEYGSVVASRPGKKSLRYTYGVQNMPVWRSGRALWCMFHHGSIANIGNMGIVDLYRLPLDSYYMYRKELRGIGMPANAIKGKPTYIKLITDKDSITTNGLSDAMIIAEYYNSEDQRVNCKSPIKLTVIKGGGIFPTGKDWIMKESNGSLADGSGAIEMRSYISGEIIVEAVSGDLPSTRLTIIAIGDDSKLQVVYPLVPESFKSKGTLNDILSCRPVSVSSERSGHELNMANDGDEMTYWSPVIDDKAPRWQIDTEGMRTISSMKLDLGNEKLKIRIDISDNNINWSRAYRNIMPKIFDNLTVKLKCKTKIRFIRISFNSSNVQARTIMAYENDTSK